MKFMIPVSVSVQGERCKLQVKEVEYVDRKLLFDVSCQTIFVADCPGATVCPWGERFNDRICDCIPGGY